MPELLVADRKYFLHIMSHFSLCILVFFKIHEAFFSFFNSSSISAIVLP